MSTIIGAGERMDSFLKLMKYASSFVVIGPKKKRLNASEEPWFYQPGSEKAACCRDSVRTYFRKGRGRSLSQSPVPTAYHGQSVGLCGIETAVKPEGRVKLGSLLAEIGRQARLTEEDAAIFDSLRDKTPARVVNFDDPA